MNLERKGAGGCDFYDKAGIGSVFYHSPNRYAWDFASFLIIAE